MLNRLDPEEAARKAVRFEAEQRATHATRLKALLTAERITRKLCRRSGVVDGFAWDGWSPGRTWRASSWHRSPPLPFHSTIHKGGGWCRVCGQKIYAGGSHLPSAGPEERRTWHDACCAAYFLMTKPSDYAALIVARQKERCAITGDRIQLYPYFLGADVDHEVPLFRVARDHAGEPWHELIRFWGLGNLRAVTHAAHVAKNASEARERAGWRALDGPIGYGERKVAR